MSWIVFIGFFAAICTTFSFLPQAIKSIKTKQTKDLSLMMYVLLVIGVFCWVVYGILIKDWPVIIANAITLCINGILLILKIKYK